MHIITPVIRCTLLHYLQPFSAAEAGRTCTLHKYRHPLAFSLVILFLPIHLHVRSTDFASVFWLDLSNPAICTCNLDPFSDSTPPKRASLVATFSPPLLLFFFCHTLPSSAILLAFQLVWTFSAPMSSQHGALVRSRVYGHRRIV